MPQQCEEGSPLSSYPALTCVALNIVARCNASSVCTCIFIKGIVSVHKQ